MDTASTNGNGHQETASAPGVPGMFQPPGPAAAPRLGTLGPGGAVLADPPGGPEGINWAARFAWVTSLLLDPPRDQHGHFTDDSEHRRIAAEWLDALNLDDPQTPDYGRSHYILIAFELPPPMRDALGRLMGEMPNDASMSRLMGQLLVQYLRQRYALPE